MPAASVTVHQRGSRLGKIVAGFLVVLVLIYLSVCTYFYLQQDQMTFPAPREYARATPSDVGIPFEDLHIPVNGSEQIHAWWIPASNASDRVLLVFHANGYVLEQAAHRELTPLHGLGTNLLMIDYRGYGSSSPGSPNEQRVYEDARAAFSYLTVQRRISSRDIVFLGRSIGTGPRPKWQRSIPKPAG
jgi:hypothetical protein